MSSSLKECHCGMTHHVALVCNRCLHWQSMPSSRHISRFLNGSVESEPSMMGALERLSAVVAVGFSKFVSTGSIIKTGALPPASLLLQETRKRADKNAKAILTFFVVFISVSLVVIVSILLNAGRRKYCTSSVKVFKSRPRHHDGNCSLLKRESLYGMVA